VGDPITLSFIIIHCIGGLMNLYRQIELLRAVLSTWHAALGRSLKGQGLVEYALILMFVAIAVIVILSLLGPAIGNIFSNVVNQL
jgi:pilus assembly protein Flp/PilA